MSDLKYIRETVESSANQERIRDDYLRYQTYSGAIESIVKESIKRQFIDPGTIKEMNERIVVINIMKKIISKLATIYKQPPIRMPKDENPNDQELIDMYSSEMLFNRKMKFGNAMFELDNNVAIEPFISSDGVPSIRILPAHTYTIFGFDPIDPTVPTDIIKHVYIDPIDFKKNVYHLWNNEQFLILDYEFKVNQAAMNAIGNPEGINPYGVLPVTYINKAEDRLIPISDDDLLRMQILLPLLLTDLCYGSKYQIFALLALIGADSEKLSFKPNSVISLPEGASIQAVKPNMDIDAMLRFIKEELALLLSSRNLKVDGGDTITVGEAVSGVSKMLDHAELTEGREDKIEFFRQAEEQYWYKFAHNILPYWVKSGLVDPSLSGVFSPGFELSIVYPDMKVYMPEKEKLEIIDKKIQMGLMTRRQGLKQCYPSYSDEEIDALLLEIENEDILRMKRVEKNLDVEDEQVA